MIRIEGLTKRFTRNVGDPALWRRIVGRYQTVPVVAIDALDLHVEQGQFFSLLGPNGAGKTSTVRVLCTLLLPDEGSCRVAGCDVATQPREVRRNIGVSIRGERSVYWKITGRQNLRYFAGLYGMRGEEVSRRIGEVTELVGLTGRIDDYVERYSMGMKQRLAIAVSLLHRPPVLLLDEPTIGLDPNGARALRSLLRELCEREGVTIFYTTHYLHEAEELSHRLAIIHEGRKVLEGSPDEVRSALGDNRIVEVQLAPGAEASVDSLRNHAMVEKVISESRQPTVITLRLEMKEAIESVVEIAAAEGFANGRVLGLSLVRPTLEDVFASVTGEAHG